MNTRLCLLLLLSATVVLASPVVPDANPSLAAPPSPVVPDAHPPLAAPPSPLDSEDVPTPAANLAPKQLDGATSHIPSKDLASPVLAPALNDHGLDVGNWRSRHQSNEQEWWSEPRGYFEMQAPEDDEHDDDLEWFPPQDARMTVRRKNEEVHRKKTEARRNKKSNRQRNLYRGARESVDDCSSEDECSGFPGFRQMMAAYREEEARRIEQTGRRADIRRAQRYRNLYTLAEKKRGRQ